MADKVCDRCGQRAHELEMIPIHYDHGGVHYVGGHSCLSRQLAAMTAERDRFESISLQFSRQYRDLACRVAAKIDGLQPLVDAVESEYTLEAVCGDHEEPNGKEVYRGAQMMLTALRSLLKKGTSNGKLCL